MIYFDLRELDDPDDRRDWAEENYWRHYCPGCDASPCVGDCEADR